VGDPQAGDVIDGRYRVEGLLGEGGMAGAYRVVDDSTGRRVALKCLRRRDGAQAITDRNRLRLRHEFHTVARLQHPCIVEVYDYGLAGDVPYYTMELLEGQDLKKLCPMPALEACAVLRDVAAALAFLHARGLVHRDITPGNVRCAAGDGRAKLIDFGVIATVGVSGEIAGTPPYIAPESGRGLPLDHRADLFSLGALAYWLLTNKHAFRGRTIAELESAWRHAPPRPSSFSPDVPAALDELVLSLLSIDPLGRPGTAAEVVDRLGATAGLEPAPELETVSGYLASAELVGRQDEMNRLRRRVGKLVDGTGSTVLIEAPTGTGKSRLLREVALEAQIAGTTVLTVSGDAGRGPYGVGRAIARELLAVAPSDAVDAAQPHVAVVGRVLPELRARFPEERAAPLGGNPREDRMQLQAELAEWILEVAKRRRLVIIVDDVQRSDEASTALLAALAHKAPSHRLLLIGARRTDEPARAADTLAALRGIAHCIRLRGLQREETAQLVQSLFGEGPGLGRIAQWMHDWSGGSPLHCIELARDLVDRGTIRFHDGVWSVQENIDRASIPAGLAEALDEHVAQLPAGPRELAEVLSVTGGEIELELCAQLFEHSEEDVFAALDTLEEAGVLARTEAGYRFRHDGLREALLRRLDDDALRALHRRIGDAMAAGEVTLEQEPDVGWHLLRGGDELRGATLLEHAAMRLYETQSFHDALPLLTAVLDVYERKRIPRRRCLELRQLIIAAGQTCNREAVLKYADDTIAALSSYAGLGAARALAKLVGRKLGLYLGLLVAAVRWVFTLPARRGPPPAQAVRALLQVSSYAGSVHLALFDRHKLRAVVDTVEPFAVMTNRVPQGSWLLVRCFYDYMLGQLGDLRRHSELALEIFRTDRKSPIDEVDRKMAIGGLLSMRALGSIIRAFPKREFAEMEQLGLRFFEIAALQVSISYHRFRGEEERARQLDAEAEILFVQLGSMFQLDAWQAGASSLAYAHNYDVHGLKRTIERLARLVEMGYSFQPFLDIARGEYYRERDDIEASRKALERALTTTDPLIELALQPGRCALAETVLVSGDAERARALAQQAYEKASDPETGRMPYEMRALRILALAEARLGDTEAAARRLNAAIDSASNPGFPSVCGLLHEARARVAAMEKDWPQHELSVAEMERWLRPTNNPALIGRIARLVEQHSELRGEAGAAGGRELATIALAGSVPTRPTGESHTVDTKISIQQVSRVFQRCRTAEDRAELALRLLIESTDAAFGFLYLFDAEGELACSAPPRGDAGEQVVAELHHALDGNDPQSWDSIESLDDDGTALEWRPVVLRLGDDPIGAAAVIRGSLRLRRPSDGLCDEVVRALADAGDLRTASGS
jgi:hypothetical protein